MLSCISKRLLADYFLLLDGALFAERMRPALAASWRRRSFEPCREFCAALLPGGTDPSTRTITNTYDPRQVQLGVRFEF